jgi:4-amino-4-deoxy-L-arabinose transferase-like glycosyltransferase
MRALALLVGAVTIARLSLLLAGPETDPDAFAHAMAGRRMWVDPGDVGLHWVWLPFWHAVHALSVGLGGGLFLARAFNVAITGLAPFVLAALLAEQGGERTFPWLAGMVLALDPLTFALSVTGQSEPMLQLLLLSACWAAMRRSPLGGLGAGLAMSAAVMTRYEAWAVVPLWLWWWWRASHASRSHRLAAAAGWALPALTIAAWCAIHGAASGEMLQFLRHGGDFARGYLDGVGYPWGREPSHALMLAWYVVVVPAIAYGPLALVMLFGLCHFHRRVPGLFALTELAALALLTIGWLGRRHLGLPRHAVGIAPLYATLLALGLLRVVELLRAKGLRLSPRVAGAIAVVLLSFGIAWRYPALLSRHRSAYAAQARVAAWLRGEVRAGDRLFCDVAPVEVLSDLPPEAFTRWQLTDVADLHLERASRNGARVWVVTSQDRAAHLEGQLRLRDGDLVVLSYPAGR